jgi:hypothetical protein
MRAACLAARIAEITRTASQTVRYHGPQPNPQLNIQNASNQSRSRIESN